MSRDAVSSFRFKRFDPGGLLQSLSVEIFKTQKMVIRFLAITSSCFSSLLYYETTELTCKMILKRLALLGAVTMGTHPLIIELIKVEVCKYNILHCSSPLLSSSISFYRSESMIGERGCYQHNISCRN